MPKKATKSDSKRAKPAPTESEEQRSRTWATIIYPESSPDFEQKIAAAMIEGFLSPLHTDTDEETLMDKKPHHHFEMRFVTKKSREQVLEVVKAFGGAGAERVNDFRAYARYLCHLDQPHKKRYDVKDVKAFGSLDYLSTIESVSDRYEIIGQILDYCEQNEDILQNSFSRLLLYARKERPDWFRHLCDDSARIVGDFLKSKQWEKVSDEKAYLRLVLGEDAKERRKKIHEFHLKKEEERRRILSDQNRRTGSGAGAESESLRKVGDECEQSRDDS